jgi:hypothetical protein
MPLSGTLGGGQFELRMFNDRKKFEKKKKKNGEGRMENGEFSTTIGVGVEVH